MTHRRYLSHASSIGEGNYFFAFKNNSLLSRPVILLITSTQVFIKLTGVENYTNGNFSKESALIFVIFREKKKTTYTRLGYRLFTRIHSPSIGNTSTIYRLK